MEFDVRGVKKRNRRLLAMWSWHVGKKS